MTLPLEQSKRLHELGYEFPKCKEWWAVQKKLDDTEVKVEPCITRCPGLSDYFDDTPSPSLEQLLDACPAGLALFKLRKNYTAKENRYGSSLSRTDPSPLIAVAMLLIELKK